MAILYKNFRSSIINSFPLITLYYLSISEIDTHFSNMFEILSFNLQIIIIYYWMLKNSNVLGNGHIFFAGIINDVVQNLPIGISSINYLLLCVIASFFRTRTLVPNLIYDWILFLVAILIVSSIHFTLLSAFFDGNIKYGTLMSTAFFSFLVYPLVAKIFNQIYLLGLRQENVE